MPMKLRSRSKPKQDDTPSTASTESPPLEDQRHQKSKSKIWRLFDMTRSPIFTKSTMARFPGDESASKTCDKSVATSVYEGGTILEEEYQDSIGMQSQKCQSLLLAYTATGVVSNSSVLCAITPAGKSVELAGGGGAIKHGLHSVPFLSLCRATVGPRETRHHSTSMAPQHSRSNPPQDLNNGDSASPTSPTALEPNSIYNEPCDSKNLQTSTRRSGTRRASLAAGIYCDTEHHKAYDSSPRGSADSLPLQAENLHPAEHSKRLSGLSVGANSSVPLLTGNGAKGSCEPSSYFSKSAKETCRFSVDSGSSSVSTSRDASAHTNSLFEVASPPPATADLSTTTFPGGSPSRMSQTESEAAKPQPPPPPPPHSPSCQDRPVPQRQHISPVDRRKLSPRSRTAQNMATAIAGGGGSSQNYTNCPQGNTIISHHPASPFAPLPRVSPGGQTSPPAVSSRIDPCCQQHSQSQRCCCCACCSELVLSTAAGLCSRSPTEPCVCSQHAKGGVGGGHLPASSPSSRSNNVGPDDDVGNNTRTNTVSGAHCPRTVQPVTSRQDSAAGHRKEISATYEEAWDLKMARRLPGVDVTRLVSVSPAAVTAIMPGISGGVRSISLTTTLGALEAAAAAAATATAAETRKSLSPAPPAQFTAGGAFRASERLIRHNGVGSRLLLTAGADSQQQPQPQDDSVVGCAAAAAATATALRTSASSSRSSFCSHSPSPLLPVLTSTEETTVVPRRVNKGQRQCSYRNSSTDASFGRDAAPAAHCHRKHSADVKLSLSMNLDQEADASSGNGPTPTENTTRRLPPDQQKGPQRGADRPLSSTDAAASPVPTPEPALSANGGTCTGPGSTQPSSHHHQRRIRSPRDNHNLLASGVLSYPADASVGAAAASSGHQSPAPPPPPPATTTQPSQAEEGGVEAAGGNNTALLPPMSRLLTDFDSLSTDSYEEAWDLRHGRVISQLTSTRFIDPEEVLSEVINSGRQGIGFLGNGGSNCQQQQQPETADQMSQLKSGAGAGDCTVSSPPTSCQSSLACHRNAPAYAPTAQELKPLHEQTWFHPNLSRSDAETCLRSEPEGSFLVRNSETNKNDFSLTIKHNGFLHMKISRNIHGKFILGEYSQPYSSIPEMISHYERTRVPVRGADSVVLCHPR